MTNIDYWCVHICSAYKVMCWKIPLNILIENWSIKSKAVYPFLGTSHLPYCLQQYSKTAWYLYSINCGTCEDSIGLYIHCTILMGLSVYSPIVKTIQYHQQKISYVLRGNNIISFMEFILFCFGSHRCMATCNWNSRLPFVLNILRFFILRWRWE